MLQRIKNLLYWLVVWSGLMYHIGPIIFFLRTKFFFKLEEIFNHEEADDAGHKLRMSRLNGRNYPIFCVQYNMLQRIPQLNIRNDDVLLCSFPKAGCHWVQEILHMLVTGRTQMTKLGKEFAGGIDFLPAIYLDSIPSPRVLNSHLLYRELPTGVRDKNLKIIFLARNPKDSLVSFFHHHKGLKEFYGYDGDLNGYFQMFMEGRLEYGSYFDYILDWDKVMKEQTANPILLISYEDLKRHPLETVMKVAAFLNLSVSREFVGKILEACDFSKMKAVRNKRGEPSSKIYRKGIEGDWSNWLTDAQSQTIDLTWQQRMLGCSYQPQYQ